MLPFLFAAALSLDLNDKIVKPSLGGRVLIRTQALLGNSRPGKYKITAHLNTNKNTPGDLISGLRVRPSTVFLRDAQARRVTLSLDGKTLEPGVIWLCIAEQPDEGGLLQRSGASIEIRTRSCYQRIFQK